MTCLRVETVQRGYDVHVACGALDRLGELWPLPSAGRRAMVVCDDNVAPLYLARARLALAACGFDVTETVIPHGEAEKNLSRLEGLYGLLYERRFARDDVVVALGGGVVGDLAGYAAATYLRGLRLFQVPTTLLAMVDASVGGKVAVDFREGKNHVGTFYQPWLVVGDPDVLRTLDARQVRCGWAEVIKHGFIAGGETLAATEREAAAASLPSEAGLAGSIAVKAVVVASDEREEAGRRDVLNLGHTVGHAIEAAGGFDRYPHGEAVGLGLRAALRLSERLSGLSPQSAQRGQELLSAVGLAERLNGLTPDAVIALIGRDKKARYGKVGFVLLEDMGRPRSGCEVPDELIEEVVTWLTSR